MMSSLTIAGMLFASSALADTIQRFEGDLGDTDGEPKNLLEDAAEPGEPAEVLVEDDNHFLRLAAGGPPATHNSFTFPSTEPVSNRIVIDFDFRIKPLTGEADGLGFAFLDADEYPEAQVPPVDVSEEPEFRRSIAVAIDVFQSDDDEPQGQHVSLHYGAQTYEFAGMHVPDVVTGDWVSARVLIEHGEGGAWVSVALRPAGQAGCTVVDRFKLSGVEPYRGKAWFGARAGGIFSSFDLDNVRVGARDPAVTGAFMPAMCMPIVPIHASLMPDGRILTWDRHDYVDDPGPFIVDPDSGWLEPAAALSHDLFCSGHTHVGERGLFTPGGHWFDNVGVDRAAFYCGVTDRWSSTPPMNDGRWYPTATARADESVVVLSGTISPVDGLNQLPQLFDSRSGEWRDLTGALKELPLYPWAYSTTDGRVFVAGPQRDAQYLDVQGDGEWQEIISSEQAFRDYGSSVSYAPGKILIAGGSECAAEDCRTSGGDRDAPTNTMEAIDLAADEPAWTQATPMHNARRQFTMVVLADGSVLAVGGTSGAGFSMGDGAVLEPELWDPNTDTWQVLERGFSPRLYHHVALLLPDAQVWIAGSGHPASDDAGDQPSWEIFSPPYLHTGAERPVILDAPTHAIYGERMRVQVDAAAEPVFNLARLGAVTHGFDQSALFIPGLESAAVADGEYEIAMHADANTAPPGPYMLFAVVDGVPSRAAILFLGTGDEVATCAGPLGPTGPAGDVGPAGDAGPAGNDGDAGPAGPIGDAGTAGPAGDAGVMGDHGEVGSNGDSGAMGDPGSDGSEGDSGSMGEDGLSGTRGDAGPRGLSGDAGPPGADGKDACGCRVVGHRERTPLAHLIAGLALMALRLARRRRSSAARA